MNEKTNLPTKFRHLGVVGLLAMSTLLLVGLGAKLRAQNEVPAYESSEQAAQAFMMSFQTPYRKMPRELSQLISKNFFEDLDSPMLSMISKKSKAKLNKSEIAKMLMRMNDTVEGPAWEGASDISESGNKAVVSMTRKPTPEVFCIMEANSWRVDLVATYANWYQMSEEQVGLMLIATKKEEKVKELRASCQSNMKEIASAMYQYSADNDEKLPLAKQWTEALWPYTKSEELFTCPSLQSGKYGYAMNWKLSNKNLSGIKYSGTMGLLYESTVLRPNQSGEGADMAFRHLDGTNIGFVDGHVKWFHKDPRQGRQDVHFTFNPKN